MHPFQKIDKGIDKVTYTLRLIQININDFKNGPLIINDKDLFNKLLNNFSNEFQDKYIYIPKKK